MLSRFFAVLFCAVVVVSVHAEDKKKADEKPDTDKMFTKLDADTDGKVTAEEFAFLPNVMKDAKRAKNTELTAAFAKLDKNKDKKLTAEEFKKVGEIFAAKTDPKKK